MAQPGDYVRFLNSMGGGRIASIEGNIAHVEDEDGFEIPVLLKECVVVDAPRAAQPSAAPKHNTKATDNTAAATAFTAATNAAATYPTATAQPRAQEYTAAYDNAHDIATDIDADTDEPGGDNLNLVLAFEPQDTKRLNDTVFDAVLVNDSNYYLLFTFLTRGDESAQWTTRRAGVLEAHTQLVVAHIDRDTVNDTTNLRVDFIPYKPDRAFEAKPVRSIYNKFDNTRLFKLHAYRSNPYFDNDVIAIDLMVDDQPVHAPKLRAQSLEQAMRTKKNIDRRPVVKRTLKKSARLNGDTLEVDLHIDEIIDNKAGLSSADILNLQVDEFRRIMDANAANKGMKIIFIHGKGDGVLRSALNKELTHRYKGNDVQDASFQEYGYGATQVTIK